MTTVLQKVRGWFSLNKALPVPDQVPAEPVSYQYSNQDLSNAFMAEDGATNAEPHRGLNYEQLKAMTRVPLIAAILQTRVNQVAEFARPAMAGGDIGFQIRLKDRTAIPTQEDIATIQEIYQFMLSCGDPRISFENNFEVFLRMLVRDSLTYDQACFEVIRNRGGTVAGFMNVDSSTIRRTKMTEGEREIGYRDPEGIHFVQVLNNKVQAEFNARDLCFGIRRPRSELKYRGYGYPELEEIVGILTHLLNAEVYNASNFTNGISVSGIVAVKTKMHPQLFRAFRREFYSMLSGSHNARKTPLIQLDPEANEEIQSLNLSTSNREMEFQQWIHYNIKQLCSIYQIDPAEVGFDFGQEGVTHTMNQTTPSYKIVSSKEKGLRPLLRAIERWLNQYIVDNLDARFELVFTGLDMVAIEDQLKMDIQKAKSFMTIDEVRAMYDLEPLPDGKGSFIMDNAYIQSFVAERSAERQEERNQEDAN